MEPERAGTLGETDARERRRARAGPMNYSGYERDRFFLNVGPEHPFRELGYAVGLDQQADGRANAALDYDGDGDLDLVLLSLQGLQLFENLSPPGRSWVRFRLEAAVGDRHALGAVVRVEAGGRSQVDYVKATSGFSAAVSLDLHFGLDEADTVDAVAVEWPDGTLQSFGPLAAGRLWQLRQGDASPVAVSSPRWPERLEDSRPAGSVTLPERLPLLGGGDAPLPSNGSPTVVNLWASWCAPCREELPVLQGLADAREDVNVVLVNVDEDREAAARFAREHAISLPVHRPTESLVTELFGPGSERIRLPATIVVDGRGAVRRTFARALTAGDLDAAIAGVQLDGLERGDGELLAQQGLYELEMDRPEAALEILETAVRVAPRHVPSLVNLAAAHGRLGDWPRAEEVLRRAVALRPDHELAQANLGVALATQGRYGEALVPLRRAVELSPGLGVGQYYLAVSLLQTGDAGAARESVERWLAEHPGDARFEELYELLEAGAPLP